MFKRTRITENGDDVVYDVVYDVYLPMLASHYRALELIYARAS